MSQIDRSLAEAARAWPFEEARKLVARIGGPSRENTPAKGYVLFETGYGPSGLPHIGTFGEVVRTTMVRQAFRRLSDVPTRLYCFSDDMDGLRKVPDNVPNKEMLAAHLGKPLTSVPDPFSNEHPSFGAAHNVRLRTFLDSVGFEYGLQSAPRFYPPARFDRREGREGPHPVGRAFSQDREDPGRRAAGGLQLRAVPRRAGPEDLQVQGQRALG